MLQMHQAAAHRMPGEGQKLECSGTLNSIVIGKSRSPSYNIWTNPWLQSATERHTLPYQYIYKPVDG